MDRLKMLKTWGDEKLIHFSHILKGKDQLVQVDRKIFK